MWKFIGFWTFALVFLAAGTVPLDAQPAKGKDEKKKVKREVKEVKPEVKLTTAQLIAVLKSDAPQKEKADACRHLSIVGTKEAVPVLAGLLGDEKLAHMARYGLEPIPDPSVDEALRDALGKLKGNLLVGVVVSIGVRHDAQAVPALTKLLADTDKDVAHAAARSLGSIGTADSIKSLSAALTDGRGAVQLAICEGLFRAAEAKCAKGQKEEAVQVYDSLRALKTAPQQIRAGGLRGAILARGKDGLPLIQANLKAEDYVLFAAAIRAAQELNTPEVTTLLTRELDQLPPNRQIVVRAALGKGQK